MNKPLPEYPSIDPKSFHIPQHWSPEQALAVWEFLQELSSFIWDQYERQFLNLIQPDLYPEPPDELDPLDPDDEIPF